MPFNRLNHSILGEIRPRFDLQIQADPEFALKHMYAKIVEDPEVSGVRSRQYVFIKTPRHHQHFWSPEMSVRIEKNEYTDDIIAHCLIGPRQTVWVLFTLMYAAILLLTLFGGSFGAVQYQQQGSSIFLWFFPFGFIAFLSVFVAAKFGQRKGRDQMLHLVSFLYHSLDEITPVKRIELN